MKFKGLILILVLSFTFLGCNKEDLGTESTANNPGQKTVVVYGAAWCSSCESLKSQLNSNNIEFTAMDTELDEVDSELRTKLVNAGFINAGEGYIIPVAEVDGEILYSGEANLATIQMKL